MNPRVVAWVAAAGLVAWVAWTWFFRADPDEVAITALVEGFEAAVEAGDADAFQAGLAADYADSYGFDRQGIADRVFRMTDRVEALDVVLSDLDLDIDRDKGLATARFRAELGGEGAKADPDEPEVRAHRRVRLHLRKGPDGWLVKRAEVVYSLLGN